MSGCRRPAARLAGVALTSVLAVAVALPGTASAHTVPDLLGSRYKVAVTSIRPSVAGLVVTTTTDAQGLQVGYDGDAQVVVYGYGGEAYLRLSPAGVDENVLSPSVRLNTNEPMLDGAGYADALKPAQWRHVSADHVVRWYDQRLSWLGAPPASVLADTRHAHLVKTWTMTLAVGDTTTQVTGTLSWVPPRSGSGSALTVELAAQAAAVVIACLVYVGWRYRRRRAAR